MAKNQKAGLSTGYTDLTMPMETRFYVPKLQAMKNIVARPDAFESRLPDIPNHPYFQTVTINRDMDVAVAARLAEISEADFRSLNPSAHRPVILAAGTPQILLPWDNATVFQRNLEATPGRLASWTAWIAPTTLKPADAAAKVGMSEKDLRAVNHIPARMLIKAGSTLLVPRPGHMEDNVAIHVADHGQMALAPEAATRKTTVKAVKGDTLASLALRHGVSASAVAEWNKLALGAVLKPGQSLQLMLPVRSTAQASRPTQRQAKARSPQRRPAARAVRTARR
jgi:membrane-bound lytic murein transglycosylase D